MMRRKMIMGSMIAAAVLCACGSQEADTAGAVSTAASTEAVTESTESAVEASDSYQESQSFSSEEELNQAVGFMALSLPEYWNYTAKGYVYEPSIGTDGITSIDYELTGTDKSILLASGKGNQNFSMFMGDMTETKEIQGQQVSYGSTDRSFGAWWTDGTLSYSVDTLGLTAEENEQLLEELASGTALLPGGTTDAADGEAGMVNPMVEYETYPELEAEIDFEYLMIPESSGYHCEHIYLIDKDVVELDYVSKDDPKGAATVRTAKGTEDITGYYGMEYEDVTIQGMKVHKGKYIYQDADMDYSTDVAWWTDGKFTYAATFEKVEADVFESQLESVVESATQLNQ